MMHGREKSDLAIVAMKPANKRTSPLRRHLQGQAQRSRWSEGRGPRGMRTSKARTGLRARLACHRRWSVYGKQLPSYTRGGSRMRESRPYGSVRGARDETRVPTATAELMAAIEALKGVGAEEQEAACVALEENHGAEVGARARALLRIEQRAVEITKKLEAAVVEPEPVAEPEPAVEFHKSDLAPEIEPPPTLDEKQRMLEELADLRTSDAIQYA